MGCPLTVELENGAVTAVTGNTCPRGDAYARKEVTNPTRIVTSTVRVTGGALPAVSCKTASGRRAGRHRAGAAPGRRRHRRGRHRHQERGGQNLIFKLHHRFNLHPAAALSRGVQVFACNSALFVLFFSYPPRGDMKEAFIMASPHTHTETKKVLDRLSRAAGHIEAIKKMVEEGRDCSEVLIQLAAVRSAINNTGKIILQDHISHCVAAALETGDQKVLDDLSRAIDQFVK